MRRHRPLLLAMAAAALVPRAVDACSCMGPRPSCEAAWQVDAVFVAQVARVERTSTGVRAHVMPLETFSGPSDIVAIDTGNGGGDCGYAFQPGETYLIYARANAGRYSTGICNRTRPLDQATEDLDYLRTTARTPSNLGVLRGTAWRTDPNYGGTSQRTPYPGLRVVVRRSGVQEERQTDASGRYELLLPPGEYEVRAEAPDRLYATTMPSRVQLRNARGCAEADVSVQSDGRIRGRVVDARGQPVGGLPVELVAPVWHGFTRVGQPVATASDGAYEFTRVPPGTFYVAFDTLRRDPSRRVQERVFAPGTLDPAAASAIVLAPTERVAAADFVMPDAAGAVRLGGQVRTPDGQPVEGARVYLRVAPPTSIFFFGPPAVSDRNGEFAMVVPGDAVYDVTVELPSGLQRTRGLALTARPSQGDRWIDIVIPPRK